MHKCHFCDIILELYYRPPKSSIKFCRQCIMLFDHKTKGEYSDKGQYIGGIINDKQTQ